MKPATITITLIVLIILLICAMPTWAHSRNWGYAPSGGLGLITFVVLVMLAMGSCDGSAGYEHTALTRARGPPRPRSRSFTCLRARCAFGSW